MVLKWFRIDASHMTKIVDVKGKYTSDWLTREPQNHSVPHPMLGLLSHTTTPGLPHGDGDQTQVRMLV